MSEARLPTKHKWGNIDLFVKCLTSSCRVGCVHLTTFRLDRLPIGILSRLRGNAAVVSKHHHVLCRGVKLLKLLTASNCGVPKSGMFRFFPSKVVCVFFIFLPLHHQSLRLSQPNNFVDRQYARIHRAASDMLPVTCKWRYCYRFWALHGVGGVPTGALLVILQQELSGCVCLSHVSGWLRCSL